MRRVAALLDDAVVAVDEHHAGFVGGELVRAELAVRDEDHRVADAHEVRGSAVDADAPLAARPFDDVGGEAVAVVDIDDVDLLPLEQVGGFHEVGRDRAGADVVEVCVGDRRPVDLGAHHRAEHVKEPSCWLAGRA